MTVAQIATGSQACTVGTEYTLNSPSGGKTYVLCLDASPLVAGDLLEVRIYDKVISTSSLQIIDNPTTIAGPAAGAEFMSIPLPSVHGCSFTIKQTAGIGRTIPWSVRTLD